MRAYLAIGLAAAVLLARPGLAAEITIACGYQEVEFRMCEEAGAAWSEASGHTVTVQRGAERSDERYFAYLDLLGRHDSAVDILQIDVIWPSALAEHLVDLAEFIPADSLAQHFAAIVENNTVDGRLVAMPWFTDAGMLFYRQDLLDAQGLAVPQSWGELAAAALTIQNAQRAAGASDFWGYVFQGQAYEGLTCNALEWISAYGGGIVGADGSVTVNTPAAALALGQAAAWVGSIVPERVTQFEEEDARILFQDGKAAFMRNWPYVWSILNAEGSALRGKVGVAPLPRGGAAGRHAATLGGWQLAVSQYSENQAAAIEFLRYLTDEAEQKRRAIAGSFAPTIEALYEDSEVLAANPFFADLGTVLASAVARPSSQTGAQYAQVSTLFWEAAHGTLNGYGTARDNLARLENRLRALQSRANW